MNGRAQCVDRRIPYAKLERYRQRFEKAGGPPFKRVSAEVGPKAREIYSVLNACDAIEPQLAAKENMEDIVYLDHASLHAAYRSRA